MIIYSTDDYGNILKKESQKDRNGKPIFNDRKWSTFIPPDNPGKVNLFKDGKWNSVDDTRGIWFDTLTGNEVKIDLPGTPVDGLTKEKPTDIFQKWDGSKWVLDATKKASYEKLQAEIKEGALIQAEIVKMARERLGLQRLV